MTKQGGFKRAVRQLAQDTGQRYTEARAVLAQAHASPFARTRPLQAARLADHLRDRYGIRIASVVPIDDDPVFRPRGSWPGHYPWTVIVKREDGPPWIARVFSSPSDDLARVEGDAEILQFLAGQGFPAERAAHGDAVSLLDGGAVIITEFIEGGRPTDAEGRVRSPVVHQELGDLLGRLHTLPTADGAPARDGGSEEHDGGLFVGRPARDLSAAMSFLISVEEDVTAQDRELFDYLRTEVEKADDAEGLPDAFTHSNFHPWAAVGTPGDLRIVGWAGSGRGPRLPAFAWLLWTAAEAGPEYVAAAVRGYREHVELTDVEVGRLPEVLNLRPLWLTCLDFRESVRHGTVPPLETDRSGYGFYRPRDTERLAARVVALLRGSPRPGTSR